MNIVRKTCRNTIREFKDGNSKPLLVITKLGHYINDFNFVIKGKPEINCMGRRVGFKQTYWMRRAIATGKSKCKCYKKYWIGLE